MLRPNRLDAHRHRPSHDGRASGDARLRTMGRTRGDHPGVVGYVVWVGLDETQKGVVTKITQLADGPNLRGFVCLQRTQGSPNTPEPPPQDCAHLDQSLAEIEAAASEVRETHSSTESARAPASLFDAKRAGRRPRGLTPLSSPRLPVVKRSGVALGKRGDVNVTSEPRPQFASYDYVDSQDGSNNQPGYHRER